MDRSAATTKKRLPEFTLVPTDYGWSGEFPGGPHYIFGSAIHVQIDTRAVPDDPKVLPPVSSSQAALVRVIMQELPAILRTVEEAMISDNHDDPDFRRFVRNPHVWLNSETDDGETWAFVIEHTENPDFGAHTEFKGTNFVEIWAGD